MPKHPCPICGKPITHRAKLCGRCSHQGENHPSWKGGRLKDSCGYIRIKKPCKERGSKAYVLEHRYIMASHLGRVLGKDEVVHHLNGIRDDNRPKNLAIVGKHSNPGWTYIKAMQKRIREVEAELAQHLLPW